jgi:hypothetical protein
VKRLPDGDPVAHEAHANRRRSKARKHGLAWCFSCDRYQVADGEKCRVCGTVKLPRRWK